MNQKINENNRKVLENLIYIRYFVYAVRLQVTRDYSLRRLRILYNPINLESYLTI